MKETLQSELDALKESANAKSMISTEDLELKCKELTSEFEVNLSAHKSEHAE